MRALSFSFLGRRQIEPIPLSEGDGLGGFAESGLILRGSRTGIGKGWGRHLAPPTLPGLRPFPAYGEAGCAYSVLIPSPDGGAGGAVGEQV
jgi:hypothetical protein